MKSYFSYMRISTKESEDKQSYNRQEKSLRTYANNNDIEYAINFKDDCTGSTFDRPDWQRLEKMIQNNNINEGDTIVFKEISRFTRQAEEGYIKYMELMNKGINLVFLDNMTVSTDYIKNLTNTAHTLDLVTKTAMESMIKLLLIVELDRVQKEREIIAKRIKQGIQASSKKSGRKFNKLDKMTDSLKADIKKYIGDRSIKQVDLMKKHNVSRNTLKKYIEIVRKD